MDTDFDFNQIGKRMPYTTPEGFFAQMEANILDAVKEEAPREIRIPARAHGIGKAYWPAALLAAAAVAAFLAIKIDFVASQPTEADIDMQELEQAFAQLSASDQDYLLDMYQEDVFLNH